MDTLDDKFTNSENPNFKPWGMETNQFCMLMHLSQFAGYIVPFAGLALPIVMWATNKEESDMVDKQGKNILNWIISSVIYAIIFTFLIFLLIGIPLLLILAILSVVFSVIGAVKANDGIVYKYPLAINFIK